MAVTNPGFEDAGAHAGIADGWTLVTVATAEEFATYARPDGGPRGHETFEDGWGQGAWSDELEAPEAATYDAGSVETFAGAGWGVVTWSEGIGATEAAVYDGGTVETFAGAGWGVADWADDLDAPVAATPDDFESDWAIDDWQATFAGGDLTAAQYDSGANAHEAFSGTWSSMTTF